MPENFLEKQRILRFDVTLQQDWLIEQCPQQIRFFWRKNEEAMFWSFHPVADKTNNEHLPSARNHFSRSYENRFILSKFALNLLLIFKRQTSTTVFFFLWEDDLHLSQLACQLSCFCSMKQLGIFILHTYTSSGWGASPSQGYPQHWKCVAQEHTPMTQER